MVFFNDLDTLSVQSQGVVMSPKKNYLKLEIHKKIGASPRLENTDGKNIGCIFNYWLKRPQVR